MRTCLCVDYDVCACIRREDVRLCLILSVMESQVSGYLPHSSSATCFCVTFLSPGSRWDGCHRACSRYVQLNNWSQSPYSYFTTYPSRGCLTSFLPSSVK